LIENIHARALVAHDLAEVRRFNEYNRKHFIYLAQMHLHHWFHVGQRFERVPNLSFSFQFASRYFFPST
jgi:hypothetical protein